MPDHDVLVVGAGPIGLMLACLLVQEGLRVVVCERRTLADGRTRAIGIHRPGLDALDAAGLGPAVRAEALRLEGGEVRSRRRTLATLTFDPDRPVLILPQTRTDALLRDRLHALSEDALIAGCTVRAVRERGDVVQVSVDTAGGPHELTASAVVVADGVRSALRGELDIAWRRRSGRASYAMLDVLDALPGERAILHCEPGGLVESFPLPDGRRRWVVRATPHARLDASAEFRAAIEARTGIVIDLDDGAEPTSFLAAQHAAMRLQRGRVMLLGDAAHEISPIGGQGMNLGWLDAARLASELVSSLPDRMPDLARFERRVRRSASRAQRRSAFYMSMGAPAPAPVVQAREQLVRVLGSPPLRGWTSGLLTMRGL
ncbi:MULTISPECIES: FAD-dependent oxidoreductase [unclassified Microbacterium]|uniref:FAD-dependent oxidoreductase n=1 Tax=unclassified Microbacterium TaxID=2609290 RepID=UPI003019964F